MEIDKSLHPYLDRILTQGIQTQEVIDPTVHSCAFKLNLERRNEFINVDCHFNFAKVIHNGNRISDVKWFDNGCTFNIYEYVNPLVDIVAAVLETIEELKEL